MPAVFDQRYVKRLDGPNVKKGKNKRDLAEQLIADIRAFKAKHGCDRLVMVWCGSTEVFMKEAPVHAVAGGLREGRSRQSDDAIPSSMVYAYAALREGMPFANAAPNLTADIPALLELAAQTKSPLAGKDMKTGQTLIKTIIAPGLKARLLGVEGWYSTNILGNRDGEVLDDPESFKTKEESKKSALDYIFQPHLYPDLYEDLHHVVRINYYPPRGDNKEGWDNIDLSAGSAIRCSSRSTSCAATASWRRRSCSTRRCSSIWRSAPGMSGIQEWLSFYFKSPMHAPEALSRARPVHPADEAEEHAALHAGRRADHAPRTRVLRLSDSARSTYELLSRRCSAACSSACCRRCRSSASATAAAACGSSAAACSRPICDQQNDPRRSRSGDGALVGLLAGVIGAVVWLIVVDRRSTCCIAPIQRGSPCELIRAQRRDMPPEAARRRSSRFGAQPRRHRLRVRLRRHAVRRRDLRARSAACSAPRSSGTTCRRRSAGRRPAAGVAARQLAVRHDRRRILSRS